MPNLRVSSISVIDSTHLTAQFTDNLDTHIGVANVSIVPQLNNIPIVLPLQITINGNIMDIETQPLTPLVPYLVLFASTDTVAFKSVNGSSFLNDNDVSNQQLILGPIESNNVVQQFMINYLRDNIYNVFDSTTIVSTLIQAYSTLFSKALYDIRQLKNENYLSFDVIDEQKVRTDGPFDRLNEEAAYEILRVGLTPTGTNSDYTMPIPLFGASEITLLSTSTNENLISGNKDQVGYFNVNDFYLTVSNQDVTKLTSLVFTYSDARSPYIYDITKYGYQILNSQYDKDYASTYLLLDNNQFKLNTAILNDGYFSTNNILQVQVAYQYKDLGRIVDPTSVEVSTVMSVSREVIPPILNIFTLQHAPITDSLGNLETNGGVTFIDPNALTPTTNHPAFLYEIPFRFAAPPNLPGQYSINYATGMVYVFGADATTNDGTGPLPPLATYDYQYTYNNQLDYAYDSDSNDLVALPNGNLLNNSATITFNYEQVLVPNIDYSAQLHIENLSERILNRLVSPNALMTVNGPITNVFRIYNETSGEIYNVVRWNNNTIYFNYNIPPNILSLTYERASFADQLNETLFITSTLINSSSLNVFQCDLQNNNLIAASQDCIASSINTPVSFSDISIFTSELWYDANETVTLNINRLTIIGQYMIDYVNGIVYIAVSDPDNISIGTISYKTDVIVPQFPHLISVDDIYYRISLTSPKNKHFDYTSFGDDSILPSSFDISDEALLNGYIGSPYQTLTTDGIQQIGAFVDAVFEPVVSNDIKYLRSIYEFNDLKYNAFPINFAPFATFSGRTITLNPVVHQEYNTVLYNSEDGYHINTQINDGYNSPNVDLTFTVKRLSDGHTLDGYVGYGSPLVIFLNGTNSPMAGDSVLVDIDFTISDLSRVIVDYDKGDYFIDYTYLADEIIVSYEYGDNVLDFRQSLAISSGQTYYASYRVGALRDALLKNFGALINIPQLTTFDTTFVRERYRDALTAALSSFIQGPTITAMENLVQQITHIKPQIIESAFNTWALGSSTLNSVGLQTTGEFSLLPAKYDNGALIDTIGQTITFPVSSGLRLENGSFECWVIPNWNGLDNDATLTINVSKNGDVVPSDQIFIGALEYHPTYIDNVFVLDKNANVIGTPNTNKDGVYFYYDKDVSGNFLRWYCQVVDGYSDGYADDGYLVDYQISIKSTGSFYDTKSTVYPAPSDVSTRTTSNQATLFIDGYAPLDRAFTFVSDLDHYILDFGEAVNNNRFSIFKDPSGYLNFKVYDKFHNSYIVSANVSDWISGQPHQVATAWNLNTLNNQDEMHLFIDGVEVSNIIRYGSNIQPYLHEHYRTINPEEIAGVVTKNIVGSDDLTTTLGSNMVSSSLNFSAYGINNGDTIYIDEPTFNPAGYNITLVNGNTLTLSTTMPASLPGDGSFSVNKTTLDVSTEIDLYPNIAISTISSILDGNDLSATIDTSTVSSASTNFTTAGIQAGYLLRIDGYDGYLPANYTIVSVSGHSLIVNDEIPINISGATFHIYLNDPVEIPGIHALHPAYSIGEEPIDGYVDYVLTLLNDVKANDLIFINTLGINHRRIRQNYYQWATTDGYGNAGDGYSPYDGYSNVIMTRLPAPISLNQVSIDHILLAPTNIYAMGAGDGYNATISAGILTSFQLATDQPSISDNGRTLAVTITSTNNIDFTTPVTVMINGYNGVTIITETLTFSSVDQLGVPQNTTNKFLSVNYVQVSGKPINGNKNFLVLTVQEAFAITTPENSTTYPVVRFSYQVLAGNTLSGSGSTVTDAYHSFSSLDIGNYVVITSPVGAAGSYQITAVSSDFHSATINASLSPFSGGIYQVLNATTYRSGLQNGFFVLEQANSPGVPYFLRRGFYRFDYYTYMAVKLEPINALAYLGTNMFGNSILNGILDEVKLVSQKLTDTRIGETAALNQETITKDYNSLKALTADHNTLLLAHFDTFPFTNDADFWVISENRAFIQSGLGVNENFGQSLSITHKPYIVDNIGILDTSQQGTIEFWVSPRLDAQNDPNYRFYFDASATQIEQVISDDDVSVTVSGAIGKVISVKLQDGDPHIDYFAGGRVELSTVGAIAETAISSGTNMVVVSQPVLQVITVKIANDPTHTDYFAGGVIGTDHKTLFLNKSLPTSPLTLIVTYKPTSGASQTINTQVIRLNRQLPNQQTPVVVTYIPNGAQGDRIAIYKDPYGYINLDVNASGIDYVVRAPIYWTAGSWHRLKATYSVNGGQNNDTIHLFIDGYEYGNILFGTGLLYGDPHVFGSSFVGSSGIKTNIVMKDAFNQLFIGSDFTSSNTAWALLDNLRISNIARPVYMPFGESIDVNYNSNLNIVFPVTPDLYTTLLLDFGTLIHKNTNFAVLANKNNGGFDFTINIYDSFDIVSSSAIVKNVLETLINTLKSATSRAYLKYFE